MSSTGPLAGLSILEFAGLGPAPLAGQLLADQGADVIVIDRKSGQNFDHEPNRRGKRSIALNLKSEQAVELVKKLIANTDVLIEGFRPGVMERLGLGPDQCLEANQRLIYARMTGWGQQGPLAGTSGHDLNYLATTGALAAMGNSDDPPTPPLNLIADYGGGTMFLLFGILSAIYERETSGRGQVVDAAMVDGVIAMMGMIHGQIGSGLFKNQRHSNWLDGAAPFYRCYICKDGKYLSVGCIEPQFFEVFTKLANLPPDFLGRQMDQSSWPQMSNHIEKVIASGTRDHWVEIFQGSDACVAPVLDWQEAPDFEHNQARGNYIAINGINQSAPAPRLDRSKTQFPSPPVSSGYNTDEILQEAGLQQSELDALLQSGAIC